MKKTYDPVAVAISAIENVSRIPVMRDDIKRMLSTGEGEPSHVMALFSDVNYTALLRLAIVFDIFLTMTSPEPTSMRGKPMQRPIPTSTPSCRRWRPCGRQRRREACGENHHAGACRRFGCTALRSKNSAWLTSADTVDCW
jgi:hypothetical protein